MAPWLPIGPYNKAPTHGIGRTIIGCCDFGATTEILIKK
jgi:hypothetical protein